MEHHHDSGAGRGLHLRVIVAVYYGVGCSDPAVQAGSSLTGREERNRTLVLARLPIRGGIIPQYR